MMYNRLQILDILSLDGFYIDSFILRSILSSNNITPSSKDENGVESYNMVAINEVKRIIKSGDFSKKMFFEDTLDTPQVKAQDDFDKLSKTFDSIFKLPCIDAYQPPKTQDIAQLNITPTDNKPLFIETPKVEPELKKDETPPQVAIPIILPTKNEVTKQQQETTTIAIGLWETTIQELEDFKAVNTELTKQNRMLRVELETIKHDNEALTMENLSLTGQLEAEQKQYNKKSEDSVWREPENRLEEETIIESIESKPEHQEKIITNENIEPTTLPEENINMEVKESTNLEAVNEAAPTIKLFNLEEIIEATDVQAVQEVITETFGQPQEEVTEKIDESTGESQHEDTRRIEPTQETREISSSNQEVIEETIEVVQEKIITERQKYEVEAEEDDAKTLYMNTQPSTKKRSSSFFTNLFGATKNKEDVNLYHELKTLITPEKMEVLEAFGRVAQSYNYRIFLVGGAVRDVILSRQIVDIDILVEGNAIMLAKVFEKYLGAKILKNQPELGTAKIEIEGFNIDLASTREESYPKAGKLPVLKQIGCALELDIVRRDFTVNTMALALNGEKPFELIDDLFGKSDLEAKELRILHKKSFTDDPTRIIRGLRFAVRFGLHLEHETYKTQQKYLQSKTAAQEVCFERVKSELRQTFELNSATAYNLYLREGIYKLVNETVNLSISGNEIKQIVDVYGKKLHKNWLIYFGASLACFTKWQVTEVVENLLFSKQEATILTNAIEMIENPNSGMKDNFVTYRFFQGKDLESILIYYLQTKDNTAIRFIEELQKITLEINGEDLINLGIPPSPMFSTIFQETLKAKLNGIVNTKEEELLFAKDSISRKKSN